MRRQAAVVDRPRALAQQVQRGQAGSVGGQAGEYVDGVTLVLYAVAAAVIGGTSLFGGRGKASQAVLGGLVIAAIDNGMGLQGYSAYVRFIVTALVLLAAVTIDALTRRGGAAR